MNVQIIRPFCELALTDDAAPCRYCHSPTRLQVIVKAEDGEQIRTQVCLQDLGAFLPALISAVIDVLADDV